MVVGLHHGLPPRLAGIASPFAGLALAMVSANTVAEELFSRGTLYRSMAGLGSLPVFVASGAFLGFYSQQISIDAARYICLAGGAVIGVMALVGFAVTGTGQRKENGA